MPTPRKSRVLEKIRAGKKASCYKVNLTCPRVSEIIGMYGFDAQWVCQEHIPNDHSTIENCIRAAKMYDMDTIVRVAKGGYSDLIRPLECDASAIMVPHLMSLEEAEYIAHTTKFAPVGLRPLDGGNADGMFCQIPGKEYIRFVNENRLVIVQIEDPDPLKDLDKICEIPGIDMLFFGPGDFSQAIGDPCNFANPEIARVRKLVVDTAHKHGKLAGTVSLPSIRECYAMGYDLVSCGADVTAIGANCASISRMFEEATK